MKRRKDLEVEVPKTGGLPKVRRQIERICESIGVEYNDLAEMRIEPDLIHTVEYIRNEDGKLYRDGAGRIATRMNSIPVDTISFLGDEGDF